MRPGYSLENLGAPSDDEVASTAKAKWVSTGVGSIACYPFGSFVGSLVCGYITMEVSDMVIDDLDLESTDYHMQVGPVYFNFQVGPDADVAWLLENEAYRP